MQTPGHVRLNQVTGHHQLLNQFAYRCPGSCPANQQYQRCNTLPSASANGHKQQAVGQHVHSSSDNSSWLPVVSSKYRHCQVMQQQRIRMPVVVSAASAEVVDTITTQLQTAAVAVGPQPQQQDRSRVDLSALPIADRVKLLLHSKAARVRGPKPVASRESVFSLQVLTACSNAGVHGPAATYVLNHVVKARLTGESELLHAFLTNYKQLVDVYGSTVVLQWLRKVPSVIRNAPTVSGRLHQLQLAMTRPGQQQLVALKDVLELTRRCPQVLGVDADLILPRARAICDLLGRPHSCMPDLVAAAPALLGMSSSTLESKVKHLRTVAASHPHWAQTYTACSTTSLAVLLTYSRQRYARLQFLLERGKNVPLRMTTVLSYSDEKMVERYPAYSQWYREYQQKQQQLQEAAAAAATQQKQMQPGKGLDHKQQAGDLYHWSSELQLARVKRQLGVEAAAGRDSKTAVY